MKEKYTAHQLAKELGVADSTVSRALSGKGRVGEELSLKIIDLANERGLCSRPALQKATGNIGIVLPKDAWDGAAFFMECLEGITNSLAANGYDILLCMTDEEDLKPLRRLVESQKADAYILLRALKNDKQIKYLTSMGKICILIGSCEMDIAQIDTNHVVSGRDLTMYLLMHGMKRIAYVGGKTVHLVNQARLRGFLEAHERLKMDCDKNLIFQDVVTMLQSQLAAEKIMTEKVDCIMCSDDLICMKILQALTLNGIHVPADVAVASLNNGPFLDHYVPQITSVAIDARELGTAAGQQAVKILKGKNDGSRHLFGYNLLFRGSTKRVR